MSLGCTPLAMRRSWRIWSFATVIWLEHGDPYSANKISGLTGGSVFNFYANQWKYFNNGGQFLAPDWWGGNDPETSLRLGLISYPKFLCVIISYLLIILSFIFHLYRLSSLDLLVVLTCAFWVLQGKLNKTSFRHYQLTITGPLVTITGDILTIPYGIQPIYMYILVVCIYI